MTLPLSHSSKKSGNTSVLPRESKIKPRIFRSLRLALALAATSVPAFAVDYTWTGTTNNTWNASTPANWGGTTPANSAATTVIFGNPASARVAPSITASVTVGNILFNSGASAFTIGRTASNTLTLTTGGSVINNSTTVQTFSTAVVLGGTSTWNTANGNLAVSGPITGTGGSLTKTGSNMLTLSGTNTYTGGTTVSAGTLEITGGRLGTGGVANSGILRYNGTGNLTEANVISGTGSLTQAGTGTTSLTATNTYQGGTTISGGALQFSSLGNFGSGRIALNGGALRWASGSTADISSIVDLGGGALDTNGNNITLTSALGGSGPLIKAGAGILTLSATPSSVTSVSVTGGTLRAGGVGALTSGVAYTVGAAARNGSAALDLNGYDLTVSSLTLGGVGDFRAVNTVATGTGLLTLGGNVNYINQVAAATISGHLDLGGATRTFTTVESFYADYRELLVSAAISGNGGLIKSGTGLLALSGANTYTGTTTVNGGVLEFASGSLPGAVTLNGYSSTLQWAAGNTENLAAGVTLTGNGGTLNTGGNNITLASAIGGTGLLTKMGDGVLTLASTATPAISARVLGGTLRLSADNTLRSDANMTVAAYLIGTNAVLDLDGHDLTVGSLTMAALFSGYDTSNSITTGTGTLTVGGNISYVASQLEGDYNSGTATISGRLNLGSGTRTFSIDDSYATNVEMNITADVVGSGGLIKTGAGNLVLSGATSYPGDTTVSGGTLRVNLPSTSNLRMNGGVFELTADRSFVYGAGAGQVQWTGGGGGFSAYGGNRTVDITDGSGMSLDLVWGGSGFVAAGTSLALSSTMADSTVTFANDIDLNGATRSVTVNNGSAATDAVLSGTISNGGLNINGGGALKLSGANTYAGGTTVSGGLVEFSAGSLGSGDVSLTGAELRWATGNTDSLASRVLSFSSDIILNTNGNDVALGAALSGGGSYVTKTGQGILTLNAASSSYGYFKVMDGTLRAGVANAFSNSSFGIIEVNAQTAGGSATFDTNGYNFGAYIVTFGGTSAKANTMNTISTGSGKFTFTTGGSIAYTRATLAQNDPGAAFFTGNLELVNAATFAIEDSSNTTEELTVSANISGAYGLTKNGAGTLIFSGNNTYTGSTSLNAGTLRVQSSTGLGTGSLVFGGGNLQLAGNGITLANTINLGTAVRTINVLDGTARIDATLSGTTNSGAGGINKTGAGTLRLTGAKTFTGNTTVTAGILLYATQNALYNGATGNWTAARINVLSGATAAFNIGGTGEFTSANIDTLRVLGSATTGFRSGSLIGLDTTNATGGNFTYASNIANPNAGANVLGLAKLGTGTLTLTGTNTYTGATTVNAGTLLVNGSIAGAATVKSGAILGGSGTLGGALIVEAGGTLAPGNSPGQITLLNDLTMADGAFLEMQFAGLTSGLYDQLDVQGLFTAGGTLSLILIDGFNPLEGATFTIFNGATPGYDNGAFTILTNLANGLTWDTSELASTGVLTVTAVPEPSTAGLMLLGAVALLFIKRRKQKLA